MTIVILPLLGQKDSPWAGIAFLAVFLSCSAGYGYLTVIVARKAADDTKLRQRYQEIAKENDRLWEQHDHFYSNNFMLPQGDRLR